jgi:hypothetical protein
MEGFVLFRILSMEEVQCNLAEKQVCNQEAREYNIQGPLVHKKSG